MTVIIDGTTGITTPGETNTGNLSVTGTTTLTTVLPVTSGGTGASSLSGITVGTATSATTATNLASGVAGAIPYQSGSGATGFSAAGSSGQVLTSAGVGTPTWTTPSAGALIFVGSTVATPGASTMALTSGFSSTYANYLLLFNIACQEFQGSISVEIALNGTYDTSIGYFNRRDSSDGSTEVTRNVYAASSINMCSDLGGSSDGSKAGTIAMTLINATSTTNYKTFSWQGSAPANSNSVGASQINGGGGILDDISAVSGIRISCSGRVIRNGNMRLYAFANS